MKRLEKEQGQKGLQTQRWLKRTVLWVIVLIVIGGSLWGIVKIAKSPSRQENASLINPISEDDQIKGNKAAKVVLVEYSDFQCPACKAYHPVVKQLLEEVGDKIEFVYRHFPLPQHANAKPAAYAAEAAGRQGKFWEMHDLIFENQNKWSEDKNAKEIFISYAGELALDAEQFKKDFEAKEIKDKVEKDYKGGVSARVNHTPTFFLNGKEIENPRSYDEFKNLINQTIAQNP